MFNYIIIGTGFAGSVIAERIATILDKNVLVIEKRNHIGGNCYDEYDTSGILNQIYGPHIFHTDNKNVWDYLSQFTDWYLYQHKVLGHIDGKKVPIPFNINTLYEVFPQSLAESLEKKLIEKFGYNKKVPILHLMKSDDKELKFLSDYIYEKIFLNYSTKQWGLKPEQIDPEVTGRVPVYISRDNGYFQDKYQGIPALGYTEIFKKLLSNKNIKLMLNTNFNEVIRIDDKTKKIYFFDQEFKGKLIYTGMIDEFFNYKEGELPYRSIKFVFKTLQQEYFQKSAVVNYPNNYDFTRITESKIFYGQKNNATTIITEYPQEYDKNHNEKNIPYYPVFTEENKILYNKYNDLSKEYKHLIMLGRLAEYKYYDMDDIIERALNIFEKSIRNE